MIILSLLWFWFGMNLSKKNFCAKEATNSESATGMIGATGDDCNSSLVINDKDGGLDISSSENFQFTQSSGDLNPPTSDMAGVISQLAEHLETNSNRFMQITGLYHESEENNTDRDNLGEARAYSVRSYLLSKGIEPAQLTVSSKQDNTICMTDQKILQGVSVSFNEITPQ